VDCALEARPDRDTGLIFFVSDIHSAKEDEIEATPDVGPVFIGPNDKAYLAITGRACVMRDADKKRAAWRKTDEVWSPGGPNDTDVCLSDRAFHRGIVGWTGERCRYGLRIRQGEVDWKGAEPRREPQGNGQDMSAHPRCPRCSSAKA
jgi:hypothetical protein